MASPFRMVVIMKREGVSSNFIGQPFSIEMFEKKKKKGKKLVDARKTRASNSYPPHS